MTHTTGHAPSREEDQRLEVAMGLLLRIGVIAAAVLVVIGGVLVLRHPRSLVPDYTVFHPPGQNAAGASANVPFRSISGVLEHLGDGSSIIALGLLVLVATPIARVIFAIIGFARERDWLYTVVSLIVLAILAFSLMHGR